MFRPLILSCLVVSVLALPAVLVAQEAAPDPLLQAAAADFIAYQTRAMFVLGGWAVANMVAAPVGALQSSGWQRDFWIMNGGWNVVNLAIAGWALTAGRADPSDWQTLADVEAARRQFGTILWVNAGLDVAYIATGAALARNGRMNGSDRRLGFGRSVVLQGAFLLVFDTTVALLNR
jgi:hypothetical protein